MVPCRYTKKRVQLTTSRTKWRSRVRSILQTASNSFKCTPQSAARILLSTSALALAKQSDEETSDGLDRQDASRPLSVDGEAVPGGEQAPARGRPRRSDPDLSAVREGDLSDRLHQQDDRGLVCPPCKVHGELVRLGGPSGFMYLCVLWMYVSAM